MGVDVEAVLMAFQSTRPLWGATMRHFSARQSSRTFQSTRPLWGATYAYPGGRGGEKIFQSTRPLWGATLADCLELAEVMRISIHAPLVGRDVLHSATLPSISYFNPRAPCGARPMRELGAALADKFQSTRPLWGATANLTKFEPQICAGVTKMMGIFGDLPRRTVCFCSTVRRGFGKCGANRPGVG